MPRTHTFDVAIEKLKKTTSDNITCVLPLDEKLLTSSHPNDVFKASYENGLMSTILQAYSKHIPLVLRPDDVWQAITCAFGKYVVKNSEAMRKCFVDFEGKKEVVVMVSADFDFADVNQTRGFLSSALDQIRLMCNNEILDWFKPNFTTTTWLDETVNLMVLMGALKEYFQCTACCDCGFSQITLLGEKEDWIQLLNKTKFLRTFTDPNLVNWSHLLGDVLQHFVDFFDGKVDDQFWQRAIKQKYKGSGGDSDFTGWFLVFAPFDREGYYVLSQRDKVLKTHKYGCCDTRSVANGVIDFAINFIKPDYSKETIKVYAGSWTSQYVDGAISPVPNYLISSKPYITLEMYVKYFNEDMERRGKEYTWSKFQEIHPMYPKFTHFLTEKYFIPQDMILDMFCYIINRGKKEEPTKNDLIQYVKSSMMSKWISSGPDVKKYIVMDRLDELTNEFIHNEKSSLVIIGVGPNGEGIFTKIPDSMLKDESGPSGTSDPTDDIIVHCMSPPDHVITRTKEDGYDLVSDEINNEKLCDETPQVVNTKLENIDLEIDPDTGLYKWD